MVDKIGLAELNAERIDLLEVEMSRVINILDRVVNNFDKLLNKLGGLK